MPNSKPLVVTVDDEKFILELYHDTLEELCDVITFSDSREAYQYIIEHQVSLVILDRKMPYLSGDDLCRKLREHPASKTVPIMMISSLDDIDDITNLMKDNIIDTYLIKPSMPDRIYEHVASYLKQAEEKEEENK